jgi:glucokinase
VNVPWTVDAAALEGAFGIPRVELLNDLAAMAYAVPVLEREEVLVLQEGRRVPTGNAAIIAAGTGLGEALLHNVEGRLVPSPTEAGHADFGARTRREIDLLQYLIRRYGRADVESVVSGPGLVNIFGFLHPDGCEAVSPDAHAIELPALISSAALEGRCARCREALDLFVEAYGAEAGNLALRTVATGGVYLGGGIAPKILPALQEPRFRVAFQAKEPMNDLLRAIPIAVILNTDAGLLGAAVAANRLP